MLAPLATLVLCAAPGSLVLDVRAEARARAASPLAPAVADAALEPRLALVSRPGPVEGELAYAPRLSVAGGGVFLHRGELGLTARPDPRWTWRLSGRAARGTQDLTDPTAVPAGAPDPLPGERVLPIFSLESLLALEVAASPRLRLGASARFGRDGGLTLAAKQALPRREQLEVQGSLAWDWTRRDVLEARVGADRTSLLGAPARADRARLELRWQHALSRPVKLGLTAGVADARGPDARGDVRAQLDVLGGAQLDAQLGRAGGGALSLQLDTRLASYVDRLTGAIYPRLESAAALGWQPSPALRVELGGAAARALETPREGPRNVLAAMLGAAWALGPRLALLGGVRADWQGQSTRDTARALAPSAFLALAFTGRRPLAP